jgi:hypothetical protein
MPTTTPNLGLTKPDVGQSNWSGLVNGNFDILDGLFPGGHAGISSIGLSLPAEITVTGSPLTASGTLTGVWASQAANRVFAGPTSGGSAVPSFRLLVAADIPSLSATYLALAGGTVTGPVIFTGTAISGASGVATSGANFNSDSDTFRASYWTGAAAGNDDWSVQNILGAGTNPTSVLTFAHTGSTGNASALFPAGSATAAGVAVGTTNFGMRQTGTQLHLFVNGNPAIQFVASGGIQCNINTAATPTWYSINNDCMWRRLGSRIWESGGNDSATPAASTIQIGETSRPGTDTDIGGANGIIRSGNGTGIGTVSSLALATPSLGSTGSAAQAYVNRLTVQAGSVTSTEPIIVPDTAGSGVPSLKGANNATGVYLNGVVAGLVSANAGWITIGNTAQAGVQCPSVGAYSFSSSNTIGAAGSDTFIVRDAANNVAFRNGANSQTVNIYGSFTDASNWERLRVVYDGVTQHRPQFIAEKLGTGVCNGMDFSVPSGTNYRFSVAGANAFFIGSTGCTFYNGTATVAVGLPPIYGTQSQTGLVAALGATTLLSVPAAGLYRVSFNGATTTSGTGTTATVTITWNDGNAKSFTSATFALNAVDITGQVNGVLVVRAAVSTTIQISTTVGAIGTSVYRLDATAERLQ